VITAHGKSRTPSTALKLGAFDFVSKPVDLAVLRKLVNTAQAARRRGAAESRAGGRAQAPTGLAA
jgi:two-component system response regulator PilR (NtrC family)